MPRLIKPVWSWTWGLRKKKQEARLGMIGPRIPAAQQRRFLSAYFKHVFVLDADRRVADRSLIKQAWEGRNVCANVRHIRGEYVCVSRARYALGFLNDPFFPDVHDMAIYECWEELPGEDHYRLFLICEDGPWLAEPVGCAFEPVYPGFKGLVVI